MLARLTPLVVGLLVSAPVFFLLASFFEGDGSIQAHVLTTTGPRYFAGTVLLCLMVAAATTVIGAGAAVLVSLFEFPGRRILSVALTLPLAMPAYIAAYAYADLFGPFGVAARVLGAQVHLPDIRTLPGAAFILTLSVYPYVYLAMRASFQGRSAGFLDASRSLGASPAKAIWTTLLPAGRAAFAGGLALALMETAADFGVADYFGVQTLSVGIFRTWYGLGDLAAASQLAAGLFLVALLFVLIER
ncbi:MAG: ABC transporter permease subunit, partial [Parvularculaceae bacterium]